MRILLAQNSLYYPAHGGGDKSNRLLMEALAARGHACRVVARISRFGRAEHEQYLRELAARSVAVLSADAGKVAFRHQGVEAHVVTEHANLRACLAAQSEAFRPDAILTSTDDPAQILLETAFQSPARLVYLARATLALPFGPDSAFPSQTKAEMIRRADAAVGVSEYVAAYLRKWGPPDAVHVPISLLEPGPYPDLGKFENEFVTLVNPCAVKGISLFLALADALPRLRFAAVPTWGTNAADRAALAARPNVSVLDPVDQIDDLLRRTRVLLVPSLWAEARSRIVVEAMLRGVPVMASNVGGIPEAKLGVPYLLPVRPIERYRPVLDEQMVPVAEAPPQDAGPWLEVLRRLTEDPVHYSELSAASRAAALDYAAGLSVVPFEQLLERVIATPKRVAPASIARTASALESLSPERRRLLTLRLRKKSGTWFSAESLERPATCRLFCFPHAGGGASAFAGWAERLPAWFSVCAAQLPGREKRTGEPAFTTMESLISAVHETLQPYLDRPFAFFGHSMGAVVAFELARRLREQGQALPQALLVSAARAPQFREGYVPPPAPSDDEFLEQVQRGGGLPAEVLENAELLRLVLPALRADAALYRDYIYRPGAPLACAIRAYGGAKDPNVTREHLEAWGAQTTGSFALTQFPGGHFFVRSAREAFLAALCADLAELMGAVRG